MTVAAVRFAAVAACAVMASGPALAEDQQSGSGITEEIIVTATYL